MRHLLTAISLLFCLVSCGDSHKAVPLPYAFPRFTAVDTATVTVSIGPVETRIREAAKISIHPDGKADIAYPTYRAAIYMAALQVESDHVLEGHIYNRRHRIALNSGGATATTETFETGGFSCTVVTTPETPTPVQFYAVGRDRRFVSGAAAVAQSGAADSIRPTVEALHDDIVDLLLNLR